MNPSIDPLIILISGLISGLILGFIIGLPFSAITYFIKTKEKISSSTLRWWLQFVYMWKGALWSIVGMFLGTILSISIYDITWPSLAEWPMLSAYLALFLMISVCAAGSFYGTTISIRKLTAEGILKKKI
jgi:drug/metabolite transporter (DMT)-like permease